MLQARGYGGYVNTCHTSSVPGLRVLDKDKYGGLTLNDLAGPMVTAALREVKGLSLNDGKLEISVDQKTGSVVGLTKELAPLRVGWPICEYVEYAITHGKKGVAAGCYNFNAAQCNMIQKTGQGRWHVSYTKTLPGLPKCKH